MSLISTSAVSGYKELLTEGDILSELKHFIAPICRFCHSFNHLEDICMDKQCFKEQQFEPICSYCGPLTGSQLEYSEHRKINHKTEKIQEVIGKLIKSCELESKIDVEVRNSFSYDDERNLKELIKTFEEKAEQLMDIASELREITNLDIKNGANPIRDRALALMRDILLCEGQATYEKKMQLLRDYVTLDFDRGRVYLKQFLAQDFIKETKNSMQQAAILAKQVSTIETEEMIQLLEQNLLKEGTFSEEYQLAPKLNVQNERIFIEPSQKEEEEEQENLEAEFVQPPEYQSEPFKEKIVQEAKIEPPQKIVEEKVTINAKPQLIEPEIKPLSVSQAVSPTATVKTIKKNLLRAEVEGVQSASTRHAQRSPSADEWIDENEEIERSAYQSDFERKNNPMSYLSCRTTDQLLNHLLKHHIDEYHHLHKSPHREIERRINQIKKKFAKPDTHHSWKKAKEKRKLSEGEASPDYDKKHYELHKTHSPDAKAREAERKAEKESQNISSKDHRVFSPPSSLAAKKSVQIEKIPDDAYNFTGPHNAYTLAFDEEKVAAEKRSALVRHRNSPSPVDGDKESAIRSGMTKEWYKMQRQMEKELKQQVESEKAREMDEIRRKKIQEKHELEELRLTLEHQIDSRRTACLNACNREGDHENNSEYWKSWEMLNNAREWLVDGNHLTYTECFTCKEIRDKFLKEIIELEKKLKHTQSLLKFVRKSTEFLTPGGQQTLNRDGSTTREESSSPPERSKSPEEK